MAPKPGKLIKALNQSRISIAEAEVAVMGLAISSRVSWPVVYLGVHRRDLKSFCQNLLRFLNGGGRVNKQTARLLGVSVRGGRVWAEKR